MVLADRTTVGSVVVEPQYGTSMRKRIFYPKQATCLRLQIIFLYQDMERGRSLDEKSDTKMRISDASGN